ncbi:hypothetical protein AGLY_018041 [Aphis glycines]|uniref:Uncharacterized protein n=1 Tax=Aphis glycines TaxID=307491 RepID=A0A6G0SV92_APHGL|nr:hypothetical protein AGLY_018041 [Aphis glycines]
MDPKIMIIVQNSFALCSNLLPETNKCFEDTEMHSRPHKINIINLINQPTTNMAENRRPSASLSIYTVSNLIYYLYLWSIHRLSEIIKDYQRLSMIIRIIKIVYTRLSEWFTHLLLLRYDANDLNYDYGLLMQSTIYKQWGGALAIISSLFSNKLNSQIKNLKIMQQLPSFSLSLTMDSRDCMHYKTSWLKIALGYHHIKDEE